MQCSGTCTAVNVTSATPLATALMIKVEISFPFIDGAVSWKNQGKCYKLEISNILFWIEILFEQPKLSTYT